MALATADAAARPAVRMVLLKSVDPSGFVFFTSHLSRKAREIAENPQAALCFHWPTLGVQVRVEGPVSRASAAEADAYFATRPRESQIGAWASRQSAASPSRADLMARFEAAAARFAGRPVPRPEEWGGYRIAPRRIEFWTAAEHRLHDRLVYTRQGQGWTVERLDP